MAHEVETMAFANQVPWHGLGNRVNPDVTIEEMLKQSGLDWRVTKEPLYRKVGDEFKAVKDRFALTRSKDNRVLTITGKVWHATQNAEALEFFRQYAFAGGARLETAGSLRGGKVVWGLANLGHSFKVGKTRDEVGGYLLFTLPHQVGQAINIRLTTVRVVCANTMAFAMGQKASFEYSQNHLSAFNFEAAREAIGLSHERLIEAESNANKLAKLKLNHEDTVRVLAPWFDPSAPKDVGDIEFWMQPANQNKQLSQVLNSVQHAPGATPGTGWGVLNGVTHWADHVVGRSRDTRMLRSWTGDLARVKRGVESDLLQMAA